MSRVNGPVATCDVRGCDEIIRVKKNGSYTLNPGTKITFFTNTGSVVSPIDKAKHFCSQMCFMRFLRDEERPIS